MDEKDLPAFLASLAVLQLSFTRVLPGSSAMRYYSRQKHTQPDFSKNRSQEDSCLTTNRL